MAVALALGGLVGYAGYRWLDDPGPRLRPLAMRGAWMKAAGPDGYAAYLRRTVRLPGPVKHAWVSIAARDGFELSINGNPAGRLYLWRPTRPFQSGSSEGGQALEPLLPLLAMNFPREYQWSGHRNDYLPVVLDVTPFFEPGANVLALEVESRTAPAFARLDGEITLWSGETIRLDSGAGWLGEPVPPARFPLDWTAPGYPDVDWRGAEVVESPPHGGPAIHFAAFDPRAVTTPPAGDWLRHPGAGAGSAIWFEADWDVPGPVSEAWIRVAANRPFDLFVDDRRATPRGRGPSDLDAGDWIYGAARGTDAPAVPELLDPDEVGSLFVGDRFEQPRHGDPTSTAYKKAEDLLNRTRDKARATSRSDLPGTYDPIREEGEGVMPHEGLPPTPQGADIKALGRDRGAGVVFAYGVRRLLRPGRNRIAVRLAAPASSDAFDWSAQVSVDGESTRPDGRRSSISTRRADGWWCRVQAPSGAFEPAGPAASIGPARLPSRPLPATVYRGPATDPTAELATLLAWIAGGMVAAAAAATAAWSMARSRVGPADASNAVTRALLAPATLMATAVMVDASWIERHETIWMRLPWAWPSILAGAALLAILTAAKRRGRGHLLDRLAALPETRAWPPSIVLVLVACAVLRIYKADFQALDDDEYASVQAVVGIARTGAPAFVPEGVYYTRSPFYHYLIGGVVRLLGEDIWTMRDSSAFFAVATALLTYRCASRHLHRPWVGMGSMVLFAIHPFAIFSGHLARFYQQQQFFALLTFYFFCEGFAARPSQAHRYMMVAAFLWAVLSQEITAIMGVQIALAVVLLGRDGGWSNNVKLLMTGGCAMSMIVVDLLVFQTRCLTRTEGVSPNVEASIKAHFWDPYNVFALFFSYSRLHLMPSLLLAASLPMLARSGGRIVWALLWFVLSGAVLTNLLVSHVSLRYQYWLIPLWLLLAVRGVDALATGLGKLGGTASGGAAAPALGAIFFAGIVLAWSPWRVPASYETKILGDSTGAFRYIRSQLRPGDAIAANEPHTHAAYLEAGRVDYDLSVPLLQDFVMLRGGRLIDRNGGAEAVGSLGELAAACRRHGRLWVVLNREKFRTRGKNLRWEYPGARLELFVRRNMAVKFRGYLFTVYLWDAEAGHLAPFRNASE